MSFSAIYDESDLITRIQCAIHVVRRTKIILDFDLADLYKVETKALNQAVKRNATRFPRSFVFMLSPKDVINLKSQIVTSSLLPNFALLSHFVRTNHGGLRKPTYAFTEHGIKMLPSVFRGNFVARMNLLIFRAWYTLDTKINDILF